VSAAEKQRPSRRQQLADAVAAASQQFAHQLADAIVSYHLAEADADEPQPVKRRRTPVRFVPTEAPTAESLERGAALARKIGAR
jgi:hypothetical protein